jgi:transposase
MALATKDSWASMARRLGANETTLRNWVHDHLAEQKRLENPLSLKESEFEELRRLRREVKELRLEKEILREAATFFAWETIQSAASGSSPSSEGSTESSGSAESWDTPDTSSPPLRPGAYTSIAFSSASSNSSSISRSDAPGTATTRRWFHTALLCDVGV